MPYHLLIFVENIKIKNKFDHLTQENIEFDPAFFASAGHKGFL
jgi:hypothetical protein